MLDHQVEMQRRASGLAAGLVGAGSVEAANSAVIRLGRVQQGRSNGAEEARTRFARETVFAAGNPRRWLSGHVDEHLDDRLLAEATERRELLQLL